MQNPRACVNRAFSLSHGGHVLRRKRNENIGYSILAAQQILFCDPSTLCQTVTHLVFNVEETSVSTCSVHLIGDILPIRLIDQRTDVDYGQQRFCLGHTDEVIRRRAFTVLVYHALLACPKTFRDLQTCSSLLFPVVSSRLVYSSSRSKYSVRGVE